VVAVTAPALDDLAGRPACDQTTPEPLGRDVPGKLGELPSPGVAREQRFGDACAHAAPSIPAEHEELDDLADALSRELRVVADQREAGESPVHPDHEVTSAAAGPETLEPGGGSERPIGIDAPTVAAEVVEIELHQPPHRRALAGTDGTKAPSHRRLLYVAGLGGVKRTVVR
jgi:hypothetical protein